jgi:hypothetical protein
MSRGDLPATIAWDEQPASLEEIAEARAPMTEEERQSILDLVDWFTRRYPTFAERDAYIRRKWREAQMLRQAGVR